MRRALASIRCQYLAHKMHWSVTFWSIFGNAAAESGRICPKAVAWYTFVAVRTVTRFLEVILRSRAFPPQHSQRRERPWAWMCACDPPGFFVILLARISAATPSAPNFRLPDNGCSKTFRICGEYTGRFEFARQTFKEDHTRHRGCSHCAHFLNVT